MTALRQRMINDMTVRGLAENTKLSYLRSVTGLARHYRRSPDQISAPAGELGGFVGEQEERRSCPCWTQCPAPSTSQVPIQPAASFRNEAGGEAIP